MGSLVSLIVMLSGVVFALLWAAIHGKAKYEQGEEDALHEQQRKEAKHAEAINRRTDAAGRDPDRVRVDHGARGYRD